MTLEQFMKTLPDPHEVNSNRLVAPFPVEEFNWDTEVIRIEDLRPSIRLLTFEKEYVNGICIGWKLVT